MNERVVAPSTAFQLSSLAQPRIVEITKPQRGQSIAVELSDSYNTKLDLSAVADEKMTLVQAGTKLVIQFDNQSTVIADPFFDSSGKPFPYLDVELSGGRGLTGEQFAQLVSETVGQVGSSDDDKIVPSGANFGDPFVDPLLEGLIGPLPHGSASSALLGDARGGLGNFFTDTGGVTPSQQIFSTPTPTFTGSGAPVVSIPAPGGATTQVFEAGLGQRGSEPPGSDAGNPDGKAPTTTQPGLINFTSPGARRCRDDFYRYGS